MPKDTKTLGNNKARACESLGFVHKKGCARVLTQPHILLNLLAHHPNYRATGPAVFSYFPVSSLYMNDIA